MYAGLKFHRAAFAAAMVFFMCFSATAQVAEHERRIDALQNQIEQSLEELDAGKQVLLHLENQHKDLRAAGHDDEKFRQARSEARSELKANRKKVKKMLHELEKEYDQAIHERKENLDQARTALMSYRKKLDASLEDGDAEKSAEYASWVARYIKKIRKDTHALENAESYRDASLLSMNRKIKNCGKRTTKYYSENAATGSRDINFNRLSK